MYYTQCKMVGENSIKMNAGDLYMDLIGKRTGYKWSVDRTAGSVYIDGDHVSSGEYTYSETSAVTSLAVTPVTGENAAGQSEVSVQEKVSESGINSFDIKISAGECYISFYEE